MQVITFRGYAHGRPRCKLLLPVYTTRFCRVRLVASASDKSRSVDWENRRDISRARQVARIGRLPIRATKSRRRSKRCRRFLATLIRSPDRAYFESAGTGGRNRITTWCCSASRAMARHGELDAEQSERADFLLRRASLPL